MSADTGRMVSRFVALLGSVLSLVGCVNPNGPIKTKAGNLKQEQVDAIVRTCGGPSGMVVIRDDTLTIYQSPDLAVTGCVLRALYATGETSLTTVGNELHKLRNED